MAESFGIPQLVEYLTQMSLRLAHVDEEQELIELAFHGDHGQWRMIIGLQQKADVRKLMLIVPHMGVITAKRRLECLEALMAVNYRIAMGKFGLDLDDGEVRLEEALPLASGSITFEQFQLVFGAMVQTVAMYHSLIPRLVYGTLSVQEALDACEEEFHTEMKTLGQEESASEEDGPLKSGQSLLSGPLPSAKNEEGTASELDLNDIMAEITRLFEERKEG